MMQDEKKTGLVFFFTWIFLLITVVIISGYNGLYGTDCHEYLRYTRKLADYFSSGLPPGDFFWPVNYPLIGALLSFITGPQVALQLSSIVAAAWIMYLLVMFLMREFPGREKEIFFYAVVFLGCAPFFFRHSVSIMTDITALAFACSGFYLLYLAVKCNNRIALYMVPVMVSLSVFTRFAMAPLLFPVLLVAAWHMLRSFRWIPVLVSLLASLVPVMVHFYFKNSHAADIFRHDLMSDWSVMNYFRTSFQTIDGSMEYFLPNIIYVFSFLVHPGFVFPGLLFLAVLIFKKNKPLLLWHVLWISMLSYLLFLAGMSIRNDRFLIPLLPFYLVICFPAYLSVLAYFHNRKKVLKTLLFTTVFLQLAFATRAFLPFYKYNRIEKQIAEKIKSYHPDVLYTFAMDGALRSYGYSGKIIPMWPDRIDSVETNSMMLFNLQASEKRWKDQSPMLNFYLLKDSAGAVLRETVGNDWAIYDIKKSYP